MEQPQPVNESSLIPALPNGVVGIHILAYQSANGLSQNQSLWVGFFIWADQFGGNRAEMVSGLVRFGLII